MKNLESMSAIERTVTGLSSENNSHIADKYECIALIWSISHTYDAYGVPNQNKYPGYVILNHRDGKVKYTPKAEIDISILCNRDELEYNESTESFILNKTKIEHKYDDVIEDILKKASIAGKPIETFTAAGLYDTKEHIYVVEISEYELLLLIPDSVQYIEFWRENLIYEDAEMREHSTYNVDTVRIIGGHNLKCMRGLFGVFHCNKMDFRRFDTSNIVCFEQALSKYRIHQIIYNDIGMPKVKNISSLLATQYHEYGHPDNKDEGIEVDLDRLIANSHVVIADSICCNFAGKLKLSNIDFSMVENINNGFRASNIKGTLRLDKTGLRSPDIISAKNLFINSPGHFVLPDFWMQGDPEKLLSVCTGGRVEPRISFNGPRGITDISLDALKLRAYVAKMDD